MIIKNLLSYFKNKKLIKKFQKKNKPRITTAQFPSSIIDFLTKLCGLNYKIKTKKSLMWYSSMMSPYLNKNIKKNLKKLKNKSQYSISLGTIAKGILGNGPILSSLSIKN
jgi:predicted alpha/beta-fold hydrolase